MLKRATSVCFGVLGVLSIPCWIFRCPCRFINEGQQGLVLRLGKFKKQIGPGKIVIINPMTSRLKIIYTEETLIEIAKRGYALKDGNLTMGVVICYTVLNAKKVNPYYEDIESIVRSRTAQMLEENLSSNLTDVAQAYVHENILDTIDVNKHLFRFGVSVAWLELKDIVIEKNAIHQPSK